MLPYAWPLTTSIRICSTHGAGDHAGSFLFFPHITDNIWHRENLAAGMDAVVFDGAQDLYFSKAATTTAQATPGFACRAAAAAR